MQLKGEILVLVDEHDKELGSDTRENCHAGMGRRHRAYVVFLFKGGKLLLQQRSMEKLLWPGYWDVSYTSHVYPGESYVQAAERKGVQELNVHVGALEDVFSFVYWAKFGDHCENEFCRLLVGELKEEPKANPEEIMAMKFVGLEELHADMARNPGSYTPWLKLALDGFRGTQAAKRLAT